MGKKKRWGNTSLSSARTWVQSFEVDQPVLISWHGIKWTGVVTEVSGDGLEINLLDDDSNMFEMVESRGKKNKIVPTLLTKDMVLACQLIVDTRSAAGIKDTNPYLFPSSGDGPLSAYQTLQTLAVNAKCEKPELITSSRLKKYIATVCQVMDLARNELEWLASHLSHNLASHKDFYRKHDSTIELAKISKLLLIAESGKLCEMRGKFLDDISLAGILDDCDAEEGRTIGIQDEIDVSMEDEDINEARLTGTSAQRHSLPEKRKTSGHNSQDQEDDAVSSEKWQKLSSNQNASGNLDKVIKSKRPTRKKAAIRYTEDDDGDDRDSANESENNKDISYVMSDEQEENDEHEDSDDSSIHSQPLLTPQKISKKKRWSKMENDTFGKIFLECISAGRMPKITELDKACLALTQRSRAQIRTKVNNIIKKKMSWPGT